jgi:PTS system cellobiose-specific IIB component
MSAKMRLAARKKGIDLNASARAESEIMNYIEDVDAIMVGPHLSVFYDDLKERYDEQCAVILMKKDYYGKLDGDKALDHLLEELRKTHDSCADKKGTTIQKSE